MMVRVSRVPVVFLLLVAASLFAQQTGFNLQGAGPAAANVARLPLSFEANQGQADPAAKFVSRGPGYSLLLTANSAVLNLTRDRGGKDARSISTSQVAIDLVGGERVPQVEALDPLPGKSNYLIGSDPKAWRTNVPTYRKVRYRGVYPGIDLVYYGSQRQLEYDFVVAPGRDPKAIALRLRGADKLRLSKSGELVVQTAGGELRLHPPSVYQEGPKGLEAIAGSYLLRADNTVAFRIGEYDRKRPLVIDPTLSYATYFGGVNYDVAYAVAADTQAQAQDTKVYVAGYTCSGGLATTGAFLSTNYSCDAFVLKLQPGINTLLWATYLGGNGTDGAYGIALTPGSSNPDVYVTGYTSSTNFPLFNPYQSLLNGSQNAFLTKLRSDGAALLYSTYLGGGGSDAGRAIAVDAAGKAFIAGDTTSLDFPLLNNAYAPIQGGVYVSTTAGGLWTLSRTGPTILAPYIKALAVAPAYGGPPPTVPSIVYAGTQNGGLWTSNNGGTSWAHSNVGMNATQVMAIVVDPLDPATIYAGTSSGVFKSTNSGGTWSMLNAFLGNYWVQALAFDSLHNLYAGTSSGLYKLPNGTTSWVPVTMPNNSFGSQPNISSLAAVPNSPTSNIFVGSNDSGNGLYASADGGATWTSYAIPWVRALAVTPTYLYVGTAYSTTGTNLQACSGPGTGLSCFGAADGLTAADVNSIAIDPATPTTMYVSGAGGIFKTTVGGQGTAAWRLITSGMNSPYPGVNVLGIDPANGQNLYAGSSFEEAFAAAFNSSGGLAYSTPLGGDRYNHARGVAVDASDNAYIVGYTTSPNFPVTQVPPSPGLGGYNNLNDIFLLKLPSVGYPAAYSLLMGGSSDDYGYAIALDNQPTPNVYITGNTCSSGDFPVLNAAQPTANACAAFVVKASPTPSDLGLAFSTFLGGTSGSSAGNGIAVDGSGRVWVAGQTWASDFPTLNGSQPYYIGTSYTCQTSTCYNADAFLTQYNSTGTVQFSTYLGGTQQDFANAVAVDSFGSAFVVGYTYSGDFPTIAPAIQIDSAGAGAEMFIAKFTTDANPADAQITAFTDDTGGLPVNTGTAIHYTISINNTAAYTAKNVVLMISPVGVNINDSTQDSRCQFVSQQSLRCALGDLLSSGGSPTQVVFQEIPGQTGTLTVRAWVTSDSLDIDNTNNTASRSTRVNPAGGVNVVMSHTPEPAVFSYNVTETITVTNLYDTATTTFDFTIPAGSSFVNYSGACTLVALEPLHCSVGPLVTGQSQTVTVTYTAPPTGSYSVFISTPVVTTSPLNAFTYPPTGNLSDPLTVASGAHLSSTITGAPATLVTGNSATLTIGVKNNGPDATTNATTWLPVAPGMFVSSTPACTVTPVADHSFDTVSCNVGTLANGETKNVSLTMQAVAAWTGYLTFYAKVYSDLVDPCSTCSVASMRIEFKPSATATEQVLVADRSSAVFRKLPLDLGGATGGTDFTPRLPFYSSSAVVAMSPNGRTLIAGRSVVDTPIGMEIARMPTFSSGAGITLAQGGTRAVYAHSNDSIEIVSTATFETISTVSLDGALGDALNTLDLRVSGIAMAGPGGNVAYLNPAGTKASGGGFPVATVDLSSCWTAASCTPPISAVPNTTVGTGVSGPQAMANFFTDHGAAVLALRRVPGSGGSLLIIDPSTNPATVIPVALPYSPSAVVVTKDPNVQYAYIVGARHIMVVDVNSHHTTYGQIVQNLPLTYGTGSTFWTNRVDISADGNTLYLLSTSPAANLNANLGALSVPALLSGSISWVKSPFQAGTTGYNSAMVAVVAGYVDETVPAAAPTITGVQPLLITNDNDAAFVVTGSNFSADARVKVGWLNPIVPTTVSSTQLVFTLPKGTAAQTGQLIVTNSNPGSALSQQAMSNLWSSTTQDDHIYVRSSLSYQPPHPLVVLNYYSNNIGINYSSPLHLKPMWQSGSANANAPGALSVDGSRLYLMNNQGAIFAFNLDTGLPEGSIAPTNNTITAQSFWGTAAGIDPADGLSGRVYVAAASTNLESIPQSSVLQLLAINTDPQSPYFNQLAFSLSTAPLPGTDAAPELVTVSPDGQYAYALYDTWDAATGLIQTNYLVPFNLVTKNPMTPVRLDALGAYVYGAMFAPDNATLLLAGASAPGVSDGTIKVIDLGLDRVTPTLLATITPTVPAQYPGLKTPILDSFVSMGSMLFAADSAQNLVLAFNYATGPSPDFSQIPGAGYVVPTDAAGLGGLSSGASLAMSADSGYLYFANFFSNSVAVLNPGLIVYPSTPALVTALASGDGPSQMWVSPRSTPSIDLVATMSGPVLAAPSQQISYSITVTNTDTTQPTTGMYMIDQLPFGVSFVSANGCVYDLAGVSQGCGSGGYNPYANTIELGGVDLPPGGYMTITAVVTAPSTVSQILNWLQVGADQVDPNPSDNTAYVITNVTTGMVIATQSPLAQGTVGVPYSQLMIATGGAPPYLWSVSNSSLPPGLSLDPSTGLISGTPSSAGTFLFTVMATDSLSQSVTADFTMTLVVPDADLAITAHGTPVFSGSNATYMVDVSNFGSSSAGNVVLTDTLDRYTFVSASYSGPGGAGPCSHSAGVVTCPIGSLPYPGPAATVTVTVASPGSGWASNLFHVTASQPDPHPTNNSAQIGPTVEGMNTALGANVAVFAAETTTGATANVLFSNVTQPGNTTLTATSSGPAPPAGYRSGTPLVFYDLNTTATWNGSATINLAYSGVTFHKPDKVRLFHQENGAWVDRTVAVDAAHHVISAVVSSFSLFAVFEPVNHAPLAAAKTAMTPGVTAAGASLKLDATPSSDVDGDALTYRWTGPFPEGNGAATGATPAITLPLGVSKVTLVVNDGETDSAPLTVPVTVSDFSLALPSALSVTRGQPLSLTVSITPKYGSFDGPITLACSNLPAGATCTFSSATITPGPQTATATLTLTFGAATASATRHRGGLYALWLGMLPFGLLLCGGLRRKRAWLLSLAITLLLVAVQFGCGGGSNAPAASQTTPASTVTVTVSGTSGSLTHSSTASVTVH